MAISNETVELIDELNASARRAGRTQAYLEILQMLDKWEEKSRIDAIHTAYPLSTVMLRIIAFGGDEIFAAKKTEAA